MSSPSPAIPALRRRLLAWYDAEQRPLPWRQPARARDPYCVWVSEIMLQQTRVAAAIPYYERFLARYPTLAALASANESDVLAQWSGLGYYRRARQMLAAARAMQDRHGGHFPLDRTAALALPGVGPYTAAAVLSIAAGQPWAAVDGNLTRIASRLTGLSLTPASATPWAQNTIDPLRPGDSNQALMDLAATLCLPRRPLCPRCPLRRWCLTRGELSPARPTTKMRACTEHYALALAAGRVWLRRRPLTAPQMPGLWELPAARPSAPALGSLRHAITNRAITAHIYARRPFPPGQWMSPPQAAAAPLTGLTRKILRRFLDWPL